MNAPETKPCPQCGGRGFMFRPSPWQIGYRVTRPCDVCDGKGRVPSDWSGIIQKDPAPSEPPATATCDPLPGLLRRLWYAGLEGLVAAFLSLLVEIIYAGHAAEGARPWRLALVACLFLVALPSFDKSSKP